MAHKGNQVYLGCYIPKEVEKELRGYMRSQNRSKSYVARQAISEFLEREGLREVEGENAEEGQEGA